MKIKELLTDGSKWCQGAYAERSDGQATGGNNPQAVKWCLVGAAQACYPNDSERLAALDKIADRTGDNVIAWNDDENRTWKEVKDLVNGLDV